MADYWDINKHTIAFYCLALGHTKYDLLNIQLYYEMGLIISLNYGHE